MIIMQEHSTQTFLGMAKTHLNANKNVIKVNYQMH